MPRNSTFVVIFCNRQPKHGTIFSFAVIFKKMLSICEIICMEVRVLKSRCPLFFSLNILKLSDIFTYTLCIYMFKYLNQLRNFSTHGYNTRHGNRSGRGRTVVSGLSISVIGPITWNSIPESVRNSNTLPSFKRALKIYLLSNYQSNS